MLRAGVLSVVVLGLAGTASAQEGGAAAACVSPPAPAAWSTGEPPAKPTPPKCMNLKNNTHTCSNKQFNAYNQQIGAYNDELKKRIDGFNAYNRELMLWQRGVSDYIRCEQDRLNVEMDALRD